MFHSAYTLQITVRVDNKRLELNFDCFKYKQSAMDPKINLSTHCSIDCFHSCTSMAEVFGNRVFDSDSEDQDDDEQDPAADEIIQGTFDQPTRNSFIFQATAINFLSQRLLLFLVPLSSVVGARLASPLALEGPRAGVLQAN